MLAVTSELKKRIGGDASATLGEYKCDMRLSDK